MEPRRERNSMEAGRRGLAEAAGIEQSGRNEPTLSLAHSAQERHVDAGVGGGRAGGRTPAATGRNGA
jgi:hypothetical protein